jgi:hypothetical protein
MATDKETIILDLKVDQGSAISELERTKKSIIGLKEEQQQLTKAYKAGEIAVDEYASESVRLEAILKKNQAEYNNIQKSVTGVKTQMDKLIDSNKKISAEFQNAAQNIRVAGVSVGDITNKLTAFANPATAALTVVTALGAAYARSSIGAKDLEFASNQLSFATTILTDRFAKLFSSVEDGEGFVSKITDSFISRLVGLETSVLSKLAANAKEELEQIERDRIKANAEINDKLGENSELLTDIANKETSVNDKLLKAQQIQDNLTDIANTKLQLLNRQEDQEKILGAATANKEGLERKLNEIQAERARVQKDEVKQKEKIEKQVNAIINAENKDLDIQKQKTSELRKQEQFKQSEIDREKRIRDLDASLEGEADPFGTSAFKKTKVGVDNVDDLMRESAARSKALRDKETDEIIAAQELRFATTAAYTSALTTLAITAFGENSAIAKATGIADAIVNTYTGATLALRSAPPPLSFGLAALTIANGLASVAQISRAAGGGDFVTRGPALMMVGDNPGGRERVTVEPLSGRGRTHVAGNMVAMAGGGSLTTGFDDGGITKNAAVNQMSQALMFTNAIKNLPSPKVGVDEIVTVMNRVQVKQNVAKA